VGQLLQDLYVDHLVFRVQDLAATRAFYGSLFGEPASQNDDSIMYIVGDKRVLGAMGSFPKKSEVGAPRSVRQGD